MHLLDFLSYMLGNTVTCQLTWPGSGAPGGDSDGHQHGAGLLAPAVRGHHREHVRPGLGGGQRHSVPDHPRRGHGEGLAGGRDGVAAHLSEGRGAVLVIRLHLHQETGVSLTIKRRVSGTWRMTSAISPSSTWPLYSSWLHSGMNSLTSLTVMWTSALRR